MSEPVSEAEARAIIAKWGERSPSRSLPGLRGAWSGPTFMLLPRLRGSIQEGASKPRGARQFQIMSHDLFPEELRK